MPDATEPPPPVDVERAGAVTTITLRTPALTTEAKTMLRDAVDAAANDAAVRAIVLTGHGRVFCAGQDLGEHAAALDADATTAFATIAEHYNPIVAGLAGAPKPVLVAINGTCAGAGLSLALAGDIRLCADTAKFTTAFTGIGLSFDSGLSASLSRAVGTARASELVLLAEPFTAQQALEWGLVGRLVPPDDLAGRSGRAGGAARRRPDARLRRRQAGDPRCVGETAPGRPRRRGNAQRRLGLTADHRGAVDAFLAKERPTFAGE